MITWAERAKTAISQKGQGGTAKTDETDASRLMAVSAVPNAAASAMPEGFSSVLAVPSPAIFEKHDSSLVLIEDPDRWCWPQSSAMNGAEIGTFAARLARFTGKGVSLDDGEALADKLVTRDREADDRRTCLECSHLAGYSGTWACRGWQRAGVAIKARDAGLAGDFVQLLQRCDGFNPTN